MLKNEMLKVNRDQINLKFEGLEAHKGKASENGHASELLTNFTRIER